MFQQGRVFHVLSLLDSSARHGRLDPIQELLSHRWALALYHCQNKCILHHNHL